MLHTYTHAAEHISSELEMVLLESSRSNGWSGSSVETCMVISKCACKYPFSRPSDVIYASTGTGCLS